RARRDASWHPARPERRFCSAFWPWPEGKRALLLAAGRKELTRALEIARSIDTERHSVNEADIDAHAGFERTQLLQFLPELERRRRQRHEALQCLPAIGVDADMVIERAIAVRRRRPGEIERPQHRAGAKRRSHHLHHVGIA